MAKDNHKLKIQSKAEARAKWVERGIKLAYASLESHLMYTHDTSLPLSERIFHKKCVREYSEAIWCFTMLY